jgi:hypothetical protein
LLQTGAPAAHAQRAADTTLARSGFEAVPIRIGA